MCCLIKFIRKKKLFNICRKVDDCTIKFKIKFLICVQVLTIMTKLTFSGGAMSIKEILY